MGKPKSDGRDKDRVNLAERIGRLNASRQELMRPVLERPREYVLLSIRAVAKTLRTDPATVVRIVRSMGFHSYKEFKFYLHELSIATATTLDSLERASEKNPSLVSHCRKALEQDLRNLHSLRNTLDMDRLVALAQRIYRARRILILGGDMAVGLVEFLDYKLTLLGLNVASATTPGKIFHASQNLNKRDLVFAISFRRGLRQTVEGIEQARESGAYSVGVTDTFVSPISRFADECFLTSVEAPFSNSYVAPTSLINIIFTVCAYYRRSHTVALLRKADDEQRHGYRWYSV